MRRDTMALIVIALVLVGAPASTASAFDYPEHAHATHLAVRSLPQSEYDRLMNVWEAFHTVLRAKRAGERDWVCREANLESHAECFTLSDLPALAGDHTPSPGLLIWRWLDPEWGGHPRIHIPFRQALAAATTITREEQSPERAWAERPDREEFLRVRRRYAADYWPIANPDGLDVALMRTDQTYVRLGTRGHPHFRPGAGLPTEDDLAKRRSYPSSGAGLGNNKPQNQAFAWYADNHLGALRYAAAAGSMNPGMERNNLLAAALTFEVTALHYLQDAVAAGHIGIDAAHHNNYSLNLMHDAHGADGLEAVVPPELCAMLDDEGGWRPRGSSVFSRLCDPDSGSVILRGDGSAMARDPSSAETRDLLWAALLTRVSLREMLSVYSSTRQWPFGDVRRSSSGWDDYCNALPSDTVAFQCQRRRSTKLQRHIFQLWESRNAVARSEDIRRAHQEGYFQAVRFVPVPLYPVDDSELVRFTGRGGELSVGMFFGTQGNVEQRGAQSIVSSGMRFTLPRNHFPVAFSILATALLSERPRFGATLALALFPTSYDRVVFGLQGGLLMGPGRHRTSLLSALVGHTLLERERHQSWAGVRLGLQNLGRRSQTFFVGVELGFTARARM